MDARPHRARVKKQAGEQQVPVLDLGKQSRSRLPGLACLLKLQEDRAAVLQ